MKCRQCGYKASVTAGTIFQGSHMPLRTWFRAMWWVTNQKHGLSALGLQRLLELGSYETAWSCLQKLRRAMVRPGRDRLTGEVEVDETYVGGVEPGGGRRHLGNQALVAVAAQVDREGIGRIRLRRIPTASSRGSGKTASVLLPRVHRVASLLKRWLLGTHQGGVSRDHLDYSLDESTFRFNRRTSRHRGKLFYRLVEQAAAVGPTPYARLVSHSNHDA